MFHRPQVIGRTLTGSPGRAVELESGAGDTAKDRLLQLALYVTNEIVANVPSATLRHSWYRRVLGVDMAEGAKVFMHVTLSVRGRPKADRGGISIGRNSLINQHCWIDGRGGLRIGANVNISRGVWFLGGDHNIDDPAFTTRFAPTEVGDRAFLGCRAQILAGVKIGEGAVVAAGALVTKDVPAYAVVAGVPARVVRTRRRDLHYELAYSPMFE